MAELGIFEEWRTLNSQRAYPFEDNALKIADNGQVLPDGVFVDAMFYPPELSGDLRLTAILPSTSKIIISDDNGELASVTTNFNSQDALYFEDNYGRVIGCMVPGPDFINIVSDYTFTNLKFTQNCVIPQNQNCVTAFKLPDSTIVSGEVVFEGENGITVSTEYDLDGTPVLRFDAIGVPDTPDCLPLGEPITCIKVAQSGTGGALIISQTGNIITLATQYTLADVCAKFNKLPDQNGNLPMNRDACQPPVPPIPCTPPEPFSGNCPSAKYQSYYIWPISDTIGINIVVIDPVFTMQSLLTESDDNGLPPRSKQGLKLFLKGVSTNE